MWWIGFAVSGTYLEGLQLIVEKVGGRDLSSTGDEVKSSVERNSGERTDSKGADDRGSVSTSHAVN